MKFLFPESLHYIKISVTKKKNKDMERNMNKWPLEKKKDNQHKCPYGRC